MNIPKKIQKLLNKREQLAMDLMSVSYVIDTWLIDHGADLTDPDLEDSTLTGCLIYCEPMAAMKSVSDYIKNRM